MFRFLVGICVFQSQPRFLGCLSTTKLKGIFICIRFAGFDAVTLANNHFNDFGANGAKFTIEVLRKTGIKYFGVSYGEYNTSQVLLPVTNWL